jgi:hypothetical protein
MAIRVSLSLMALVNNEEREGKVKENTSKERSKERRNKQIKPAK